MNPLHPDIHPDSERQYEVFDEHIEKNKQILMDVFKNCSDVVFRQVQIQHHSSLLLVYVDGLIDTKVLEGMILNPLMSHGLPDSLGDIRTVAEMLTKQMVPVGQTKLDRRRVDPGATLGHDWSSYTHCKRQ
ncbi:spore germination protein [Alicyclobacillus fastidiosus]|uniref:Spore germination protein n=1 Tax=Alicyclobacillus fastidiosus TaxID=392011 RepID=A0ABY6ZE08_9BACL|nr:spore germination protein [Alicyclobacillus fastidiosus]WAH40476.1 spore germination protein [Alicyclobacillus fastidiosus]GMA61883.1 hypothetical protein GCM10025859_23230 [Alicyclobacillus fastidiosus]